MRRMRADELRESYLRFFESKGHKRLPGSSLVPKGDPTLLLTSAGMVQFKPFFLGKAQPTYRRVTTCQRCLRTPDIDRVGHTARHATFFEMLGNFSFGDYFKREAIGWAWEFVTQHLEVSPEELWASVYLEDDEAYGIWHQEVGVPEERIVRLGKEDNFWEIGVGPCGPCSEIYVDRGPASGCGREDCKPGCDCGRFLEIWNLVFIQFHKDEAGVYHPLELKSIDTGMGLERVAAISQGVESIFETDIVRPLLDRIAQKAGIQYGQNPQADVSLRVITDHLRGITFMAFDGIVPGNEGRGYVMRRLLRRAVRHGRLLGIEGSFLTELVDTVIELMRAGYPELSSRREMIRRVTQAEEERFHQTLEQGLAMLSEILEEAQATEDGRVTGEQVFRLYDTYGFPVELTQEIARDRGVAVDLEGFEEAMARQRERARAARGGGAYLDEEGSRLHGILTGLKEELPDLGSRFVGYDRLEAEAKVLAILGRQSVERMGLAEEGQEVDLILDVTPFYPEGGGQVADTGELLGPSGRAQVVHVRRPAEGVILHTARVTEGRISAGDRVQARVRQRERMAAARHHTATHLLHKALREVIGDHVAQAGSLVAADRLRFDFSHFQPVTEQELRRIERRVNERILENLPVVAVETSYDEAVRQGAMALFEEKYGDRVRMIDIGGWSRELCGGTHVRQTAEVGLFHILSEGSVAAGVRRIEAVAGEAAQAYVEGQEQVLRELAGRLQVAPAQVADQVSRLQEQLKQAERTITQLQERLASAQVQELLRQAERFDGVSVLVARADGLDPQALRAMGDQLRSRLEPAVIVLGGSVGDRAQLITMASRGLASRGLDAGVIVRQAAQAAGGNGGGRQDMAQAGVKDPSRLPVALETARRAVREALGEG